MFNFYFNFNATSYNHILLQLTASILQLLITPLIFCSKRLKKGMPFLTNKLSSTALMIISILTLFMALIFNSNDGSHLYIMPFLLIFLLALFIYISWKNNITKTYLDKLKEKDIIELNHALGEKEERIQELEKENRELSKIIHNDNKLIPAMALAVRNFIQDNASPSPMAEESGNRILCELDNMTSQRKGMIQQQNLRCHALPSVNVTSIDALFKYIQQKAYEMEIDFDVAVSCDIKGLIKTVMPESALNTLLADLLENALIATRHQQARHVLLHIDLIEKFYMISIFDSGIPFSKEVLINLGLHNYTTHQDEGGSGIGLVTSYELIQKYNASLAIDELAPDTGLYTKKISVTFNHLQQYTLFTYRSAEEIAYLRQRANLLVIEK
jgi:signal transduction histidine kinase